MKKLAQILREADYRIASRLTSAEETNCYQELFQTFATSHFLTFNYDSLPEMFLFRHGRWYPSDGYGVEVRVSLDPREDTIAGKHSASLVLHLHGSLCIRTSQSQFLRAKGDAMAWWTPREKTLYEFAPSSIFGNFVPYQNISGRDDVEDRILAPVPNKAAGLTQTFIGEIYKKALELVGASGTILSIGYSFNTHDRASYEPILQALSETRDRKLILVSPDAFPVAEKLRVSFPAIDIDPVARTFKEWAVASFPGLKRHE